MLNSIEICECLSDKKYWYEYKGEPICVDKFCSLNKTEQNSITWIKSGSKVDVSTIPYADTLLFIADRNDLNIFTSEHHFILCNSPKEIFFQILKEFFVKKSESVIQSDSVVCTNKIGKNVTIGHHCYIDSSVTIGDGVVIGNNVSIECPTVIGDNTRISSGVVIGADGFGYYRKEDMCYEHVPHFGGVIIGKNVDIGANACIDRGTIDNTIIEDNVKIDNLCHVAHNVVIEKNALIIALSLLGGSSKIEENAYIAPGAIVRNQIVVGKNSIVGMGSVVLKDVEEGQVVAGVPAKTIKFSGKL